MYGLLKLVSNLFASPLRRRTKAPMRLRAEVLEARQLLAGDLTFLSAAITSVAPFVDDTSKLIVQYDYSVANMGDQPVIGDVVLRGVFSQDEIYGNGDDTDANGIILFETNIAPAGIFSSNWRSFLISPAEMQTTTKLLLKIDSSNIINEGNENNNTFVLTMPQLARIETSSGEQSGQRKKPVVIDGDASYVDADGGDAAQPVITLTLEGQAPSDLTFGLKKSKTDQGTLRLKKNSIRIGKQLIGTITPGEAPYWRTLTITTPLNPKVIKLIVNNLTVRSKMGGSLTLSFQVRENPNLLSTPSYKGVTLS